MLEKTCAGKFNQRYVGRILHIEDASYQLDRFSREERKEEMMEMMDESAMGWRISGWDERRWDGFDM